MQRLLLPLTLLLLLSCSNTAVDDRPQLAVSIEPLRYVVEAIGGDCFSVQTIMPRGASPETYAPTPRQMIELSHCKVIFRVGTLGFEQTTLPQMTADLRDVALIDLGTDISPLLDDAHKHEGGKSIDPHVWMSTKNLQLLAQQTCQTLCQLDTLHAPEFKKNLQTFSMRMDSLDAKLQATLRDVHHRAFLIYHPALGYFARDYGLRQLAVERDGKDPSPAYMKRLLNLSRAEGIRVVFISTEHTGAAAKRLGEALSAKVVSINPLDYDVPAQLVLISQTLKQNE